MPDKMKHILSHLDIGGYLFFTIEVKNFSQHNYISWIAVGISLILLTKKCICFDFIFSGEQWLMFIFDLKYQQNKISERNDLPPIIKIILRYFVCFWICDTVNFFWWNETQQILTGWSEAKCCLSVSDPRILGIVPTDHNLRDNDFSAVFPSCSYQWEQLPLLHL